MQHQPCHCDCQCQQQQLHSRRRSQCQLSMSLLLLLSSAIFTFSVCVLISPAESATSDDMSASTTPSTYSYCIVGAGPAGLGMGHYFEQASREWQRKQWREKKEGSSSANDGSQGDGTNPYSYVILDRSPNGAGEFFRKFPRHRTLISNNKRYTGKSDPEFNLRHDWNSVLSDYYGEERSVSSEDVSTMDSFPDSLKPTPSGTPVFTSFSEKYFPHADDYVRYLGVFAETHQAHVHYNSSVIHIQRIQVPTAMRDEESLKLHEADVEEKQRRQSIRDKENLTYRVREDGKIYDILVHRSSSDPKATSPEGRHYHCKYLLVASGLPLPIVPDEVRGLSPTPDDYEIVAEEYVDFDPSPENFINQSVLVLGKGNSATETLQSLMDVATLLHVASRNPIRLAHQTHYVGDVRAVNDEILDLYQLKTLGAMLDVDIQRDTAEFVRDPETKKIIFRPAKVDEVVNDLVRMGDMEEAARIAESKRFQYDRVISCMGFRFDPSPFSTLPRTEDNEHLRKSASASTLKLTPGVGKYPAISASYESMDDKFPNLYTVGTLQHARDFRKGAGGFIHGYRYLVRTLFKMLLQRNHAVAWPGVQLPKELQGTLSWAPPASNVRGSAAVSPLVRSLTDFILHRTNQQSATYQMYSVLSEVGILKFPEQAGGETNAQTGTMKGMEMEMEWIKDVPVDYVFSGDMLHRYGPRAFGILVLRLEFNPCFGHPQSDVLGRGRQASDLDHAHESNFLHPILRFYRLPLLQQDSNANEKDIRPNDVHHVLEDVLASFDSNFAHVQPLRRWLTSLMEKLAKNGRGLVGVDDTASYPEDRRSCDVVAMSRRMHHVGWEAQQEICQPVIEAQNGMRYGDQWQQQYDGYGYEQQAGSSCQG